MTCIVRDITIPQESGDPIIQHSLQRYWKAGVKYNPELEGIKNKTEQIKNSFVYDQDGIVFITVSDKVTTSLIHYSIITLYISVVLVVGQFLRGFFKGGAYTVVMK